VGRGLRVDVQMLIPGYRANLVTKALSTCPSSKIVMGGYSQGGQLVHKAAELLPESTMKAVSTVIIFGDPGWLSPFSLIIPTSLMVDPAKDNGQGVANAEPSKTLVICHEADDICLHGDLILLEHLTYAENAAQAASFVAGLVGF
jgi:cutinase